MPEIFFFPFIFRDVQKIPFSLFSSEAQKSLFSLYFSRDNQKSLCFSVSLCLTLNIHSGLQQFLCFLCTSQSKKPG